MKHSLGLDVRDTIKDWRRKAALWQKEEQANHVYDGMERWDVFDSSLAQFNAFFSPVLPSGFTTIEELVQNRFPTENVTLLEIGGAGHTLTDDLIKKGVRVKKSFGVALNSFGSKEKKTPRVKNLHVIVADAFSRSHNEHQMNSADTLHIPGWESAAATLAEPYDVLISRFAGPVYNMMTENERKLFFASFLRWYKKGNRRTLNFVQFPPSFPVEALAQRLNDTGKFMAIGKNTTRLDSALFLEKLPGAPDSLNALFREHPLA